MNLESATHRRTGADLREFLTARVRALEGALVPHTSLVASYFEWSASRGHPGDATTLRGQLLKLFPSVRIASIGAEIIYVGVVVDAIGPVGLPPVNPHLPS